MTGILFSKALAAVAGTALIASQVPAPPLKTFRAVVHLEVVRVTPPAGSEPGPLASFGPMLAQMLTPEGPVEMELYGGEEGVRATLHGRVSVLPSGAVIIQRAGAPVIQVVNAAAGTYFEVASLSPVAAVSSGVPDLQVKPTGETATIAGQKALRSEVTISFRVPLPQTAAGQSLPRELEVTGDLWLTDAFSGPQYQAMLEALDSLSAIPGLSEAVPKGQFPLRTRLRLTAIPDYEIRSEVTSVTEAPLPEHAFEVPAGFRKVGAPIGR